MNFALIFFISATAFVLIGGMSLLGALVVEREHISYDIFSWATGIAIAASTAMVSLGFTSLGY